MNRDPKVVGRARVGAETFADIINSFVDSISLRTMLFSTVALALLATITNSALFNLRARQESTHQREMEQHRLHQLHYPYYLQGQHGQHGQQGLPAAPGAPPPIPGAPMGLTAPPPPEQPKKSKWLKW